MALEELAVYPRRATSPVISKADNSERKKVFRFDVNERCENPAILQRIAQSDRAAARECIDAYGSRIWAIAKKNAASTEEAEIITQEIFLEIWKHADRFDLDRCSENDFITLLALRHLIRRARKYHMKTFNFIA